MTTLKARFDGRVLVPKGPVDLPVDCVLELHVISAAPDSTANGDRPLAKLARLAERFAGDTLPAAHSTPDASPTDGAAQHDHYLYGSPKRP